jgi:hypothetical protein
MFAARVARQLTRPAASALSIALRAGVIARPVSTVPVLKAATQQKKAGALSPETEPDEAMTELIRNFVEPADFYQVTNLFDDLFLCTLGKAYERAFCSDYAHLGCS